MNAIMTKCCHQCQRGRFSDSWLRLMDNWYGLLVVIDFNRWRVILYIDVNLWRKSGSEFW
jgi:RNA polymerase subunit RPABC4/transcription elongation factor Spt4